MDVCEGACGPRKPSGVSKGAFMRGDVIAAAAIVAGAVLAVRHLDQAQIAPPSAGAEPSPGLALSASPAEPITPLSVWRREVRIAAAADSQFYVEAAVNRREARFLVDTGATYVALRESDARAAGVYTSRADYTYPVKTANGETRAAFVTLDEIEISGLRVDGVKAFILRDEQLAVNLLGMSFLSRLESVEARRGEMILRG